MRVLLSGNDRKDLVMGHILLRDCTAYCANMRELCLFCVNSHTILQECHVVGWVTGSNHACITLRLAGTEE